MWGGVLSFLSRRRQRRRTARVVDESALGLGGHSGGAADATTINVAGDAAAAAAATGGRPACALARALLAMACAVRLDGGVDVGGAEEAWATSGWRPARGDEISHLMVRESMCYAVYA